jgi:hypothetical protein
MNRRNFLGLAAPAAAASAVGASAAQATGPDWTSIKRGRLAVCSNCGCEAIGYLVGDPRKRLGVGVCLECEADLKIRVAEPAHAHTSVGRTR